MKTIIIIIAMLCNFFAPSAAMQSQLYAKSFVCVDVSQDVATFEDRYGDLWQVDAEDWTNGDHAATIMSDKGTPEIEDDIIIAIRYEG